MLNVIQICSNRSSLCCIFCVCVCVCVHNGWCEATRGLAQQYVWGGKMQWSSNEAHQRGVITFPICLFLRVTFQLVASFADRLHLTKPRTWEGLNARSKYFLERRRSPAVIEFGSHHEPHDDGSWQHLQHCVCAQLPQWVLGCHFQWLLRCQS